MTKTGKTSAILIDRNDSVLECGFVMSGKMWTGFDESTRINVCETVRQVCDISSDANCPDPKDDSCLILYDANLPDEDA